MLSLFLAPAKALIFSANKKIKEIYTMKKGLYLKSGIMGVATVILAACSSTPNSISIAPNQNQCAQTNMYGNNTIPPSIIANNPANAPYCMSVSIQNNNSGLNANNIQIVNSGLVMSYTVGSTTYSSQMYDSAAAGITISGANQILGNIEVFDPQNCLTNSGANVVTINADGGTCTFYMQILGESNPVGVYGTSLSYNYTNGNQNYNITTNINQRVNLYAGGSNGLFVDSSGNWISGSTLPIPINVSTAVTGLARDIYGNIYLSTAQLVYQFNGISNTQLGNTIPGIQINGITTDLNGSVYIATNQGVFKYGNTESNAAAWVPFDDLSTPSKFGESTNIINIKGYENFESNNAIYATTENVAYLCNTVSDLNGYLGCHWTLLETGDIPESFVQNGLALDVYNNLYSANGNSVNWYSPSTGWQPIPYFADNTTGTLSAVYWTQFNDSQYLYVGENSTLNPNESAVYLCNPSPINCSGLQSQNGNPILGNVYAVAADGANNVDAVGNNLNSLDFISTPNEFGAYLDATGSNPLPATVWAPITNESPPVITGGALTVIKISSMLTSY
jgi:hypothetical protein